MEGEVAVLTVIACVVLVAAGIVGATKMEGRLGERNAPSLANVAYGERERRPVIDGTGGSFRPREMYVGNETSVIKTVTAFYRANTLFVRPRRRFVSPGPGGVGGRAGAHEFVDLPGRITDVNFAVLVFAERKDVATRRQIVH